MGGENGSWIENMNSKCENVSMDTPNRVTPSGFQMHEYALGRLISDKK